MSRGAREAGCRKWKRGRETTQTSDNNYLRHTSEGRVWEQDGSKYVLIVMVAALGPVICYSLLLFRFAKCSGMSICYCHDERKKANLLIFKKHVDLPSFSSPEARTHDPMTSGQGTPSARACAGQAPGTARTHLVLTHPMALVQEDLVPREVVLAGRVVVEAVAFQSFVLELSKTQGGVSVQIYTPRQRPPKQGSAGGRRGERGACLGTWAPRCRPCTSPALEVPSHSTPWAGTATPALSRKPGPH